MKDNPLSNFYSHDGVFYSRLEAHDKQVIHDIRLAVHAKLVA